VFEITDPITLVHSPQVLDAVVHYVRLSFESAVVVWSGWR
jgi:hypothetical protein